MEIMNREIKITVLTPTYNRGHLLTKLHESLAKQTIKDFQWLIIDDGSTDDTAQIVESLPNETFYMEYKKKENGGKHTALNFSHPYIKGDLVVIVDSDDYLTSDAIERILDDWDKYKMDKTISGLSYLKMTTERVILSKKPPEPYFVSDFITYRMNKNISGDQCEVIRSDLFKSFTFPVFPQERFISEGILWRWIAKRYKTVYRDIPIYICEYLEGGLTKSGRKFRMKNPHGMMENCKSFFIPEIHLSVKVKEAILYDVYALASQKNVFKCISESTAPFLCSLFLPVGCAFYIKWSR
ncbi:glycosyltransferase family 2 protein [Mitsuokella jalaludinii]|uniref:glycosyltransferase family 2 protein n=1 Tax=Mitsuokella jalaludinii TaxID=187979 RepID=UPI002FDA3FA4